MSLHPMEVAARDAWVGRIKTVPWHWFVTLTFARDLSEATALRALKRWARDVAVNAAGGAHFGLFHVMDLQPDSGRLHFHVLCVFAGMPPHPHWATHIWRALSPNYPTGIIDVRPCDGAAELFHYLLKHREPALGLVCPRVGPCKHQNCGRGVSPWPKSA